jgi:hypothetical protein
VPVVGGACLYREERSWFNSYILAAHEWRADLPFFGASIVAGEESEVERAFGPLTASRLESLPVQLSSVEFFGRALVLTWSGMETDPKVIEQAFAIGIDCLQSLQVARPHARTAPALGAAHQNANHHPLA